MKSILLLWITLLVFPPDILAAEKIIRVQYGPSQTIQSLALDDYVAAVLASELPQDFPMESLKAQAVLIRTLSLNPTQNHRPQGFDFCATTHCQLFRPINSIPEKFRQAVKLTQGEVLTYGGSPIQVLYHSQCGGHTSPNHRVFGGQALPYLKGVEDKSYCEDSPQYSWVSVISRSQLEEALNFLPLLQIRKLAADPEGRSFTVLLEGTGREEITTQDLIRKVGKNLGWEKIKSAQFTVESRGDQFLFTGKGLGHGVGLCQWGARGMASRGKNYREILRHYFPGTRVRGAS